GDENGSVGEGDDRERSEHEVHAGRASRSVPLSLPSTTIEESRNAPFNVARLRQPPSGAVEVARVVVLVAKLAGRHVRSQEEAQDQSIPTLDHSAAAPILLDDAMPPFDRITSDPARMNGQACVRNLRLTVRRVLEALATYPDPTELYREYPELEPE